MPPSRDPPLMPPEFAPSAAPRRKTARVTCKACRISKVKCDVEGQECGQCSRCVRLGLACLANEPSQRGRHSSRARLSEPVRALLANGAESTDQTQSLSPSASPTVGAFAVMARGAPLCAAVAPQRRILPEHTWALYRNAINAADSRPLKLHWLRSVLYIAKGNESWDHTREALSMATELRLDLDEALLAMSTLSCEDRAPRPTTVDEFLKRTPLPDFVAEWHERPTPTVTRCQSEGFVCWLPNETMREAWATLGIQDMLADMVRVRESALDDGNWFDVFATPTEAQAVADLYARLWASVAVESDMDLARSPSHSGGGSTASPRRMPARHASGDAAIPVHTLINGVKRGPFRASMRFVVRGASSQNWKCLLLSPLAHMPPEIKEGPKPVHLMPDKSMWLYNPEQALGPEVGKPNVSCPEGLVHPAAPRLPAQPAHPTSRSGSDSHGQLQQAHEGVSAYPSPVVSREGGLLATSPSHSHSQSRTGSGGGSSLAEVSSAMDVEEELLLHTLLASTHEADFSGGDDNWMSESQLRMSESQLPLSVDEVADAVPIEQLLELVAQDAL